MVLLLHGSSWKWHVAEHTLNQIKSYLYSDSNYSHLRISLPFYHFPFSNNYTIILSLDFFFQMKNIFSKLIKHTFSSTFISFFSSIFCSFQHIRPDCALLDLYLSISICLSNCNWYCIFNCGFQVFIDSRDITDFYMFILYSEALMNLLSSSMRIFL